LTPNLTNLIQEIYLKENRDYDELFQAVLTVSKDIGLNKALKILNDCMKQKRLLWLDNNLRNIEKTGNTLEDGFRIFYEIYLGISLLQDGEIIEKTNTRIISRWWNQCSILDMAIKYNLDTRIICKKACHNSTQEFFSIINPKLKFDRNYESLRPHTPYCEEYLILEDKK
jgi:hypothetical protein